MMRSQFRTLAFAVVLIVLGVPSGVTAQQAPQGFFGKWTINLEKSKFDPGPPPKSDIRTFEDRGGGTTLVTLEGINAQGQPTYNSYALKYDGKEWPTGYNATTGAKTTTSYRIIDPYTIEWVAKVNGKITTTTKRVASKDGKTSTYYVTGANAQGRPINNVLLFEKQ